MTLKRIYDHSLEKYILGTEESSAKEIKNKTRENGNEEIIGSPEYMTWMRKDRVLGSWLIGNMNEDIISQMVGWTTVREIWMIVEETFSITNTAKIM